MIKTLLLLALAVQPERPTPIPIGTPAPGFSLPGVDGKTHGLDDFAEARLLLILFNTNHCPTAQLYEERIKKLHADYHPRGVALVVINPNDAKAVRPDELGYTDLGDSLEDMKIRARHLQFAFPYLYDGEKQEVSRKYGPLVTPHAFLFDKDRRLRYQGRIDDNEYEDEGVKARELRDAIEALLAGREVAPATTRPRGCSVKWGYKRPAVKTWYEKARAEEVTLQTMTQEEWAALMKGPSDKVRLVHYWTGKGELLDDMVMLHWMYRKRNFELILVARGSDLLPRLKKSHASCTNVEIDWDPAADGGVFHGKPPSSATWLLSPDGGLLYQSENTVDLLTLKRTIVANLRDDRLSRFRSRRNKK